MNIRYFLGIIFLVLISMAGHAHEKTVRIATLEDYAPFCMGDATLQTRQLVRPGHDAVGFKGYSWDLLRESFHEMGYTIELFVTPWPRAMAYLEKGKADVLFPTGKNSERQKRFDYSRESTNPVRFVVFVPLDSPIEWQGLDTLNGLTIGVKRGFNYGDAWEKASRIKKVDVGTIIQGFKMLNTRRLDGFLGYELSWDHVLQQEHWTTRYRKIQALPASLEYLVALKTNPEGVTFLNAFDRGKQRMIKTGKLAAIRNHWFGNTKSWYTP